MRAHRTTYVWWNQEELSYELVWEYTIDFAPEIYARYKVWYSTATGELIRAINYPYILH